jgi:predicted esterase
MRIARRALALGLGATFVATRSRADTGTDDAPDPLELRALRLEHEVLFVWPRAPAPPARLVILLHGLAETSDEHTGARAWVDRDGLLTSVRRLRLPPLAPVSARDDWGSALATTNAALAAHPYQELAFACPYVPRMSSAAIDLYIRWLQDRLIPRLREAAGERLTPDPARIGGCSYGGWVSLEAFLRAPGVFGAWAGVQTAISQAAAASYAERLARTAAGRPLLIETSTRDPFHEANTALASALHARNVGCDFLLLPGPHDQPWLRESGTPSLLAWLDRA